MSLRTEGLPDALLSSFNYFNEGVLWLDKDGKILIANEKISKLLGRPVEELTEMVLFEINPHLNLLAWKKLWRKLSQENFLEQETEFITVKEELIPVRVKNVLLDTGDEQRCMAVIENLLETDRYKDLLILTGEAGRVGSWELDLITNDLTVTPEVYRLLGLPNRDPQLKLSNLKDFLTENLAVEVLNDLEEKVRLAIREGKVFEEEVVFTLKHQENTSKRLLINIVPVGSELQISRLYGTVKESGLPEAEDVDAHLTRFTLEYSQDMIFWVGEDGSILFANQAVCQKLGYTSEELRKLSVVNVVPGLDQKDHRALWDKLIERKYIEREVGLKTKTGETLPTYSYHHFIQFGDRKINCVFVKDITEKRNQDEIIKLTQFAIDHSSEIIIWATSENEILYANVAFFEKTGYSQDELRSISLLDLHPRPSEERSRELWRALEEKKYLEQEAELKLKSGKSIPVFVFINYIEYNGQKLACTFIRDWSQKKKRDQQLILSQFSLDRATELVFWVDAEGKIIYANEAAHHALDMEPESLMGIGFKKFLPNYQAVMEEATKNQQVRVIESNLLKKNGNRIQVEVSITSMVSDDNPIDCFIFRDVSRRKAKEVELANAYRQIEELSHKVQQQNIVLKEEISQEHNFNNIITQSKKYKQILKLVSQVAETDATVLIFGETGTGKELLARAIHALSRRANEPMIKVNCAALPENLIESELFGHEKGAFTGAFQQKKGRFEIAHMGTIFLDEIGEMPLDLQSKLLRVLQEGEFERIGGNKTLSVNVRVVAATNRNLVEMVNEGRFREDLYYRLNVFPIENMPLRDRREDIPLLIDFFVKKYAEKLGRKIINIPQYALERLKAYDFPGNIRELENIVERAIILSSGDTLNLDLSFSQNRQQQLQDNSKGAFPSFRKIQRDHIIAALERTNWRVSGPNGAARLLGLNDRTLASKMRKFGIRREDFSNLPD